MKLRTIAAVFLAVYFSSTAISQEKYGKTLNFGLGVGYYGYYYGAAPALAFNYEFDVFKNLTLAPFAAISTYRAYRNWGDHDHPYREYYYRESIIPVGVKGSYYFDELLEAHEDWDFYLAASTGVTFRTVRWENGYYGDRRVRSYGSPLFLSLHIGTEYHLSSKAGLFLDLSSGFSTLGVAVHL